MEVNLLAEFVALARHLNFSKTAQALNITQPTLSRHIVQLEEELEVQLFRRDRQSVSLTEAGTLFLPEASAVLGRYEAARRKIEEYRDGIAGSLTLGYRWMAPSGVWPQVLHVFRAQYPQVVLRLISFPDGDELPGRLNDGSLDAAILLRSGDALPSEFQSVSLCPVPLMAALREDHPLSGQEMLRPVDLLRERLVVPHTRSSMGLPSLISGLFRPCGILPAISYTAERLEETLIRVQLDNVVGLIPQSYLPEFSVPGIHTAPIAGTAGMFRLLAIAPADAGNPAVRLFFQVCRAELKKSWLTEQMGSLPE